MQLVLFIAASISLFKFVAEKFQKAKGSVWSILITDIFRDITLLTLLGIIVGGLSN